ncbi:MAG: group II intron reverse transcriptase/maturase [Methylococcales bacterium]|nr:group II intron reverse transcriptase/maturase [Methylococcales bacterium]
MLTTPKTIRTLQRKLYHKAKQDSAFRFYALYDKVYREDLLSHAYDLVRANKGAPGIDGITFKAIERGEGKAKYLAGLKEVLQEKTYRAQAVRRVWIPKPDGSERPLGIPVIKDRIVQMALKLVIEPIFEADFCDTSYGFRPKRSAHQAIDKISNALLNGHRHVIDADLSKYFDTIPHAKLLSVIAERISDGAVLALIKQWLKASVVEEDGNGKHRITEGGKGNRKGTPQGGVISPLLANLYLHLLDRIWERHNLEKRLGARIVRYADDLVILCRRDVTRPMEVLTSVLERLDLQLNQTKTKVVDAQQESFDFLGFSYRLRRSRTSGKVYPHVEPSKRSVQRLKDRVKRLTDRRRCPVPLDDIMEELNTSLRGWTGYFHYRNSSKIFRNVKMQVEERLRTHLRRRHKLQSRGSAYIRFPNHKLYKRYGLYKLPTTAGWKKAHAL